MLAGLPTTKTLTFLLAYLLRASPYYLKIMALAPSKSFLSIPGPLGLAPTRMAISQSTKASSILVVPLSSANKGKAQSLNSMRVPSNYYSAGGISTKVSEMGILGPNNLPYPIM